MQVVRIAAVLGALAMAVAGCRHQPGAPVGAPAQPTYRFKENCQFLVSRDECRVVASQPHEAR